MSFDWVLGTENRGEVQWVGGAAQVPEKRADCEGSVGDVRMMPGSSETPRKDLSDDPRHAPKKMEGR